MTRTTADLRAALEHRAESAPGPDPHALLAEVTRDATAVRSDRRRRRLRVATAAAATAVALTAGALLIDRPGDVDSTVLPAEPDPSYAQGYGIVDGELQPYTAQGLELVEQLEVDPNGGAVIMEWQSRDDVSTFAQPWCAPAGTQIEVSLGEVTHQVTCADPDEDNPLLPGAVALPPGDDYLAVRHLDPDAAGPVTVGFYEEAAWSDFPFAAPQSDDPVSEPSRTGTVIDARPPVVQDEELAQLTGAPAAATRTLPIQEAPPCRSRRPYATRVSCSSPSTG